MVYLFLSRDIVRNSFQKYDVQYLLLSEGNEQILFLEILRQCGVLVSFLEIFE